MNRPDYIYWLTLGLALVGAVILTDRAIAMDVQQIAQEQARSLLEFLGPHVIFSVVASMAIVRKLRAHYDIAGKQAFYTAIGVAFVVGAVVAYFATDGIKELAGGAVLTAIASPLSYDILRWFTRKTEPRK